MELHGYYISNNTNYNIIMTEGQTAEDGKVIEIMLGQNNMVVSSYLKSSKNGEFCYLTKLAKTVYDELSKAINGCTAKNGTATIFKLGTASKHSYKKGDKQFDIMLFNKKLCGAEIVSPKETIFLEYFGNSERNNWNMPYVKIGAPKVEIENFAEDDKDSVMDVPVRSIEEIALEKDISWLKNKKYYVVNDEETAEKIFRVMENWHGPIAYDVETSGLAMNMFGKIGSEKKKELEEYNKNHPGEEINVDYLVGLILCIEKDVSYYFPCANRKFKNLYSDTNDKLTSVLCQNILSDYTIGKHRNRMDDMARYIRSTPISEWGCDVILMERIRCILENGNLVAHNGSFEWKSSWIYNIDINLKDDTMVLHQLLYKFRTTTENRGEPSNLKHLSLVELGINQLDLNDFFVDYVEDNKGTVRKKETDKEKEKKSKKKKVKIDFSYMDYEGSRCYAPADGDCTLQLLFKYKADLLKNNSDLEYLYNVEILVACAIGYMEFYGHRLREDKIEETRQDNIVKMNMLEHKFRALNSLSTENETNLFDRVEALYKDIEKLRKEKKETKEVFAQALSLAESMRKEMGEHGDFNIGAPGQVAKILYSKYDFKLDDDGKMSVNKKILKQYIDLKDENGNLKYPEVSIYTEWKKLSTLSTKFFDNLQYFMYPGGYIFSHYGAISTATGRMSCSKPNAQQYPKAITAIVVPRPGHVHIDADFSQIEYRTLVGMAHEPELMRQFFDPDMDYHTMMAALMYNVPYALVTPKMRGDAKSFNFGIPYGMGFKSLAILLTGRSGNAEVEEAKEKYELYFKNQPNVKRFFEEVKEAALVNQYTTTFFGRKRFYSFVDKDGNYSSKKRSMALRQAGNAVIQGCLDGDTLIQTKDFGIVKIKDIIGNSLKVWDGDKWSQGDITYSGKKQKCIVHFSNGQDFICSPIHKFSVINYNEDIIDICGHRQFVECKNLKYGIEVETDKKNKDKLFVESVEITDEYIDMYDVCNTDGGYYVADGIITHNTAADIFKIAVARNFVHIRNNELLGKVLMINMIHDEILFEVNAEELNVKKCLADVINNMQMQINGFPPLYVGAGVGADWKDAKGKMAEIHPLLGQQFVSEAYNGSDVISGEPADVIKYFDNRVFEFRKDKINKYLLDTNNHGDVLSPVIGGLLGLQFDYGAEDDFKKIAKERGLDKHETEEFMKELPLERLKRYIENNGLSDKVKVEWFSGAGQHVEDAVVEEEYTDDDEEQVDEPTEVLGGDFALIDEDSTLYGVDINTLIRQFGLIVSKEQKVCGIDITVLPYRAKDEMINYISEHACNNTDDGAMQVVFLRENNLLFQTGQYVKDIEASELTTKLKINSPMYR